jgi:ribosomal protein S26
MSAEPSLLHDMTQGIIYSMAVTIMYPLMHYACVDCSLQIGDLRVGEGTCMAVSL